MNGQTAYRNLGHNIEINNDALAGFVYFFLFIHIYFSDSLDRLMMKDALRAVKDNQYDFDAWTRLLKIVEKVVCFIFKRLFVI